ARRERDIRFPFLRGRARALVNTRRPRPLGARGIQETAESCWYYDQTAETFLDGLGRNGFAGTQPRPTSRALPMLPSTTAAFRFSPRSFARFIGDRLNAAVNS